jgi:hypothetical protein
MVNYRAAVTSVERKATMQMPVGFRSKMEERTPTRCKYRVAQIFRDPMDIIRLKINDSYKITQWKLEKQFEATKVILDHLQDRWQQVLTTYQSLATLLMYTMTMPCC